MTRMTEVLPQLVKTDEDKADERQRKKDELKTKQIGEVDLPAMPDNEPGQMLCYEAWIKKIRLALQQKGDGLVELLDQVPTTAAALGHSKQLCAAFMSCFTEGTRVHDIAFTTIQEKGHRVDLMVAALEAEVSRGELFRAFRYTIEFMEDHWLRHDDPWGAGLSVTLSHLLLLRTRLTQEKLTIDQLILMRVAFLLPDTFSWLQRSIFEDDNMTVDKLMTALKPHVKVGVLSETRSEQRRAVGAAAT